MNKLPKEKKEKLILVAIGVIGALGVLYTFVLGAQKDSLAALETQIVAAKDKLDKAERVVLNGETIEATLAENRKALEKRKENMAPEGQFYIWFLKLLEQFRKDEGLDANFIVDITQPEFSEPGLLPKFPFRGAIFGVRANGYYEEIGRFLADLENTFPYMRVQDVKISPPVGSAPTQAANEKLNVEFKVVTLIKPEAT